MKDEIKRMAKEVGFEQISPGSEDTWICFTEEIEHFYNLAVRHEREACAKVAQSYEPMCDSCPSGVTNAILGRGEKT